MAKPITVRILGDVSDLERGLAQGKGSLGAFGGKAKFVGKVGGAALLGLGVAALKLGGDFQEAENTIRTATGATGDELDALVGEAQDVFATVPASLADVAGATGAVATQLGIAGDELETVTRLGVEFAEVMDAEVVGTTDDAARVMNQFGVDASDADDFFGDLLLTTQDYGIEAPNLLGQLEKMGPALQSVGLSAEGAAAFLGAANQAGVEVTRLKSPFLQFADAALAAGEDPAHAFQDFAAELAATSSETEALALANERFGTTGGAAILELVQAGVPLSDLNGLLGDNSGLVGDLAEDTRTWTDKLNILKNKVLVKLEPILSGVVDGLESFVDNIEPAFAVAQAVVEAFQEGGLQGMADFIEEKFGEDSIVGRSFRFVAEVWEEVGPKVEAVLRGLRQFFKTTIEVVTTLWAEWGDEIMTVLGLIVGFIGKWVANVKKFFQGIIDFVAGVFTGDWGRAWDGITAIFSAVWDNFVNLITLAKDLFKEGVTTLIGAVKLLWNWDFLSDWVSEKVDAIVGFFRGLPGRLAEFVTTLKDAGSDLGTAILEGLVDGVKGLASAGVDLVVDLVEGFTSAVKNMWNNFIDIVNDAVPDKLVIKFAPDIDLPNDPFSFAKLASGGPVMVGERGPEVYNGSSFGDGRVYSNGELRAGAAPAAGGHNIEIHIHGDADPAEVEGAVLFALATSGT